MFDWFYDLPAWAVPQVAFSPLYLCAGLPAICGFWLVSVMSWAILVPLCTAYGILVLRR